MTRMSVHARQRACAKKKKRTSASAPVPSAGLSSRNPPTPVASESRFQASPSARPHPTPSRGKRLRGSPTSPPTPTEEGGCNLFHLPRRWMPWIRIAMRKYTWTCFLGKPDPLSQITIWIRKMTRSDKKSFTTSMSNPR